MKTKINIDDFLMLVFWIKAYTHLEGRTFNYENLLQQAETYKFNDTPLDITVHPIDDFMIEAYHLYHKLKLTEEKVSQFLDLFPFINKDELLEETNKYKRIFENVMENYKFEDPEIRGIQRGMLSEKMNECVEVEDYENAAKLRDMIKQC